MIKIKKKKFSFFLVIVALLLFVDLCLFIILQKDMDNVNFLYSKEEERIILISQIDTYNELINKYELTTDLDKSLSEKKAMLVLKNEELKKERDDLNKKIENLKGKLN